LWKINKIGEIYNPYKSPHFKNDIPLNLLHARISSFKEAEELLLSSNFKLVSEINNIKHSKESIHNKINKIGEFIQKDQEEIIVFTIWKLIIL